MAVRKKHFFVFPWDDEGAAVDLYTIAAVGVERGGLNLQLHGGGFQRGPKDARAWAVAKALIHELTELDGVETTLYSDTEAGCETLRQVVAEGNLV